MRTIEIKQAQQGAVGKATFPDYVVYAFNPNYVDLKFQNTLKSLVLSVTNGKKTYSIDVSLFAGKTRCYVSKLLQVLFDNYVEERSQTVTMSLISKKSGVTLHSIEFCVLWGAVQMGQRYGYYHPFIYDWDKMPRQTREVVWFKNFPFSVSLLREAADSDFYALKDGVYKGIIINGEQVMTSQDRGNRPSLAPPPPPPPPGTGDDYDSDQYWEMEGDPYWTKTGAFSYYPSTWEGYSNDNLRFIGTSGVVAIAYFQGLVIRSWCGIDGYDMAIFPHNGVSGAFDAFSGSNDLYDMDVTEATVNGVLHHVVRTGLSDYPYARINLSTSSLNLADGNLEGEAVSSMNLVLRVIFGSDADFTETEEAEMFIVWPESDAVTTRPGSGTGTGTGHDRPDPPPPPDDEENPPEEGEETGDNDDEEEEEQIDYEALASSGFDITTFKTLTKNKFGIIDVSPSYMFPYVNEDLRFVVMKAGVRNSAFNADFNITFDELSKLAYVVRLIPCEDTDGVYLRWIDQYGFWQYFLFVRGDKSSKNKASSNAIDAEYTFESTNYAAQRNVSVETNDTIKCSAVNLRPEILGYVQTIYQSPYVEMYVGKNFERSEMWMPVNISSGTVKIESKPKLYDYEISIELPTIPSQSL